MCGITGLYAFRQSEVAAQARLPQSVASMQLRGPDSQGSYQHGSTSLGHCRLSILDTSDAAAQPMHSDCGRYVIVYNGEIFNYRDLAAQHLKDHAGRSSSDTEVLLQLLIRYGTACLSWLDGFFAFALHDREEGSLLLARDRYGKKPLLCYANDQYLAFASEMKALLAWDIPRELDPSVLHQYLQLNYVPQPQSMLKGVRKVRPGCFLELRPEGPGRETPFYQLRTHPEHYGRYSYEAAQQQLVRQLDGAVSERLIADVPLGAFLSGGIDSSVVVALASRHTDHLRTFSIGYKDNPFFDETKYAKLVAAQYKTDHTVFSLTNNDFLEHVYGVLNYLDEPFADSSAIPVYILSHHTRKHVTVALSGDGGDEVFAGYNKHAAEWRVRQRSLLNTLVKAGHPLWQALPRSRSGKLTNKVRQLHRFAEGARLQPEERYLRWASFHTPRGAEMLLAPAVRGQVTGEAAAITAGLIGRISEEDYNDVLLADMNLVLLSDMLVKVDLMSMANSLEIRSPFLDHKVVEFAFGLPAEYKINGQMKKRILQDAFRPMLPPELYNRPKQGFEIPLLGWFRKELWGLINDDLLEKNFVEQQGIFNPAAIEALKAKLRSSNPEDSHATVWALIVFQYWWKKWMA